MNDELIKEKANNIAMRMDPHPEIPKFTIMIVLAIIEIIYYGYLLWEKCKKPSPTPDNPEPVPTLDDLGWVSKKLLWWKARRVLSDNDLDTSLASQLVEETIAELGKTSKVELIKIGQIIKG